MYFQEFRQSVEKELLKEDYYSINNPSSKVESFFWIAVKGTAIGTTSCHYEFALDENDSNKVNLEIHFEFPPNNSESEKNASALLGKYLLNKRIIKRFDFVSQYQVGIIYNSFNLNSDSIVQDAIKALKKMNKKFQLDFFKFIKKSSCKKLLNRKKG